MSFISLITGLVFTLLMPPLFPSFKLFYLIPFLIISIYQKPINRCLWIALAVGIFVDLLSAHSRFGIYSAAYVITTYFAYDLKRHFFEDNWSTLPVMTFFFSVIFMTSCLILHLLFEGIAVPLSLSLFFIDFLFMPLCDALFTLALFTLPTTLFGKPARKGSDYFLEDVYKV